MALRFDIGGLVLAILAHAAYARADDTIALRLRYDAPQTCPNAAAFLAQVRARTTLVRPARANETAPELRVFVENVPGGNTGTLEFVGPHATSSVRKVSAADCEQVVSALALMTALAIDPHASIEPTHAVPPVQSVKTDGRREAPAQIEGRREAPASDKRTAQPVPRQSSSRTPWAFELGSLVEVLGGVTPDPDLLVRPFVQVIVEGRSTWSYAFRISGGRAHAEVTNREGSGDFGLWAGRVEPCPLRFSAPHRLAMSACLPVDVGRLEAEGRGVTPQKRVTRLWLSIGSLARVEWQVLDVLVLEIAGELFVPIVRDRFFVGSNATLHRAPAVAGAASVGLGVRFP